MYNIRMIKRDTFQLPTFRMYIIQVIKIIRNVTRHRNGQSVKSRQTRWEWQLLISIMHIHDVVTRYNNCAFVPFLCTSTYRTGDSIITNASSFCTQHTKVGDPTCRNKAREVL